MHKPLMAAWCLAVPSTLAATRPPARTCIRGRVHGSKEAEGGVARHALRVPPLRNNQAPAPSLLQQACDALQSLHRTTGTQVRQAGSTTTLQVERDATCTGLIGSCAPMLQAGCLPPFSPPLPHLCWRQVHLIQQ